MNVEEIYIANRLTEEALAQALAFTFHLVPDKIAVVSELTGDEDASQLSLICQFEETEGDFQLKLNIYGISFQDENLFIELVKKLAAHINCDCLLPDADSLSPFDMIRVSAKGEVTEARLATDQFVQERICLMSS